MAGILIGSQSGAPSYALSGSPSEVAQEKMQRLLNFIERGLCRRGKHRQYCHRNHQRDTRQTRPSFGLIFPRPFLPQWQNKCRVIL